MLMRAFKDLTLAQVGVLMAPFKAQQLLTHILLSMTYEQINRTDKLLEEVFYSRKDFKEFREMIDKDMDQGGAGWDKRLATSFTDQVAEIITMSRTIDFDDINSSTKKVASYLKDKFKLKISPTQEERMNEIIELRLNYKFDIAKVQIALDYPLEEGGAGFDKRTASKVARELEILLLMRYGNKNQFRAQE
jgi:hypothetical protein